MCNGLRPYECNILFKSMLYFTVHIVLNFFFHGILWNYFLPFMVHLPAHFFFSTFRIWIIDQQRVFKMMSRIILIICHTYSIHTYINVMEPLLIFKVWGTHHFHNFFFLFFFFFLEILINYSSNSNKFRMAWVLCQCCTHTHCNLYLQINIVVCTNGRIRVHS